MKKQKIAIKATSTQKRERKKEVSNEVENHNERRRLREEKL